MSELLNRTWEYRAEPSPALDRLNKLGAEGWELAGIDGHTFYFKRPALGFKERVTTEQRERYFVSRAADSRPEQSR